MLAVSDEVDEALWREPRAAAGVDVVLACGDLPFDYLDALSTTLDAPLVFVPGNHDPDVSGFRVGRSGLPLRAGLPAELPWPYGGENADLRVVDVAGLRVAGLGGCLRYRDGPNQWTERQQRRRARRLAARVGWRRLRDGRRVDVLLTHAPPRGVGDGDDPAHRGFSAYLPLVRRLRPRLLLHGHVHPYGAKVEDHRLGETVVRNVVGWHVFDVSPAEGPGADGGPRGA